MSELPRRQFLEIVAAAGVATFLGFTIPRPRTSSRERRIADVFGMQEGTNTGGGVNLEMVFYDLAILGAGPLTAINPSRNLLMKASGLGHSVITRVISEPVDSRFHPESLEEETKKAKGVFSDPIIQLANEVNLEKETGGIPRPAREYIVEDFIPSAELIIFHGGRPILPPLALTSHPFFNPYVYFFEELDELEKQKGLSWIKENIAGSAAHPYILTPEDDPLAMLKKMNQIAQRKLGITLPFYATEAGLYQKSGLVFHDEIVARATVDILKTPIPSDLQVEAYNLWVLSNFAQRPSTHQQIEGDRGKELRDFEVSAWRGLNGPRKVYLAVAKYMENYADSRN